MWPHTLAIVRQQIVATGLKQPFSVLENVPTLSSTIDGAQLGEDGILHSLLRLQLWVWCDIRINDKVCV